jgi:hypothetical protein
MTGRDALSHHYLEAVLRDVPKAFAKGRYKQLSIPTTYLINTDVAP